MFLSNRGSFRPETSGAYTLRRRGRRRPKSGSAIGACAVARLAGSGGPIGDYYGSANIRENRDEQAHLRDLSRDGVDQPHGRPRPVHLHGLSGLVVEVVRDVLGDGVVGVSPREGDVAHRRLAALGAFVAVLLPQELQVDADFAQLAVDVSVVRPRHGLLRLPFLGEQHRRDLVVAQQGDVPPPDALLGRPVQHLLYRMRRDVPRACDLPSGHVLRAQLDDELRIAVLCHGEPSFLDLVGNASRV